MTAFFLRETKATRLESWILGILGLLWIFYFHRVLLNTGYLGDDAYNSQISGTLLHMDMTVWQRTLDEIVGWAKGAGRIYPLSAWTYTLYHFVHSLLIFKFIVLTVVGFSILLFAWLVLELTNSRALVLIALFSLTSILQYREWFDPIIAFCFLLPMLTVHLLVSWVFWVKYLKTERRSQLTISVIFFLFALLTYEVSYPMGLIHFVIAWSYRGRFFKAFRAVTPILITTFVIVGFAIAMRSSLNPHFKNGYLGSNLALDIPKNIQAFLVQVVAPLPLIYSSTRGVPWQKYLKWMDLLPGILAAATLWFSMMRIQKSHQTALRLAGIGVTLWVLPAGLIAVSGHRDNIIGGGYGVGYLPVYLQYFGVVSVFLGLLQVVFPQASFVQQSSRGLKVLVGLIRVSLVSLLIWVAAVHLGQNRYVAAATNRVWLYPRSVTEAALRHGLFEGAPGEFLLVLNDRFAFDHYWFFSANSGKKVHTTNIGEIADRHFKGRKSRTFQAEKMGPLPQREKFGTFERPTYLLTYQFDSENGLQGFVYFAELESGIYDRQAQRVTRLRAKSLKVFDFAKDRIETPTLPHGKGVDFVRLMELSAEPAQNWEAIVTQALVL